MKSYVYRSTKKQELYLFVTAEDNFEQVPGAVMKAFGKPEFVFELELTPERRLARSDVNEVMRSLREQGFYVQMPPPPDADLTLVRKRS
ncbi:MAG: YcgL domain-containing protein [Gammaproteobacteria bacterium]|jgi:uncharacterized protein YcgL (UPF0745 family)|nr:YcgL domain-containing protein [Gammaproteobacteria bacterium]